MQRTTAIRFLTPTTNQKGDLFTRLMVHLFQALGYEDFSLDVQKPGREVDIEGKHLYQPTLLRAECKAHEGKMGGRELNAFYGVVTREREKNKKRIDAYFISLGGFTEPGRNQEEESGENATILLDSPKVIAALEKHHLLLDDAAAAAKAGECAGRENISAAQLEGIELVAYEKGYVKIVYYVQQGQRTHFALIHADGTALAKAPAQEVIDADQAVGGTLHQLTYLVPAPVVADLRAAQEAALAVYRHWIGRECGYIELDGLPANSEISSSKLKIERLFIPLKALSVNKIEPIPLAHHITYTVADYNLFSVDAEQQGIYNAWSDILDRQTAKARVPISELLAPEVRLAFLSPPGGGKSTLLKRLATEYGLADQTVKFADELPQQKWLPLLVRCRDLQDQAREPFIDLLEKLPKRLSMLPEPAAAFTAYIHEALQLGQVLLLVDGLDEITQEGNRKAFTKNLLSFLSMFPQVAMVLTSREAGFRLVADVVANTCQTYKLAPFDEADVRRLCVQWHAEVINSSSEVEQKALKLAEDIWDNEHIRGLAENPLLLTTLLVVNRRRGGELPKNRTILYGKAVEVLIQTWNAEAFDPLDEEETLTQLSYLACHMMEKGIQQIGKKELIQTLSQAQKVVPELRFAQTSPANFIKQVEYRSSLLMQVGTKLLDGEEQELFEFRHLTFQEYLAATGYVEGYHPRNQANISLADLLTPNFGRSGWREVIPLAAVLAKRNAEETMERLVARCAEAKLEKVRNELSEATPVDILRRCILDEVIISSNDTLRSALRQLGRLTPATLATGFTQEIISSKFGDLYQQVLEESYLADSPDWAEYMNGFLLLSSWLVKQECADNGALFGVKVIELLKQEALLPRLRGLGALAETAGFSGFGAWATVGRKLATAWLEEDSSQLSVTAEEARQLYKLLDQQLRQEDERLEMTAVWTLAWLPKLMPAGVLPLASTLAALFAIIGREEEPYLENDNQATTRRWVLLALQNLPVLEREALRGEDTGRYVVGDDDRGVATYFMHRNSLEVSIFAAWYRVIALSDEELAERINNFYDIPARSSTILRLDQHVKQATFMLERLGEAGKILLLERQERIQGADSEPRIFISHSSAG